MLCAINEQKYKSQGMPCRLSEIKFHTYGGLQWYPFSNPLDKPGLDVGALILRPLLASQKWYVPVLFLVPQPP
jgi:hypothetical protein